MTFYYTTIEYISAFGILLMVGILNLIVYFLLSFSKTLENKNRFIYKFKNLFLFYSLAAFNLSVMPILVNARDYKTKRIFEFTETLIFLTIAIILFLLIKYIISFINEKNEKDL